MSEQRNDKTMTANDVFWLVVVAFTFLIVTSWMDSCHANWQYRDLRDRLERLEQRP